MRKNADGDAMGLRWFIYGCWTTTVQQQAQLPLLQQQQQQAHLLLQQQQQQAQYLFQQQHMLEMLAWKQQARHSVALLRL